MVLIVCDACFKRKIKNFDSRKLQLLEENMHEVHVLHITPPLLFSLLAIIRLNINSSTIQIHQRDVTDPRCSTKNVISLKIVQVIDSNSALSLLMITI